MGQVAPNLYGLDSQNNIGQISGKLPIYTDTHIAIDAFPTKLYCGRIPEVYGYITAGFNKSVMVPDTIYMHTKRKNGYVTSVDFWFNDWHTVEERYAPNQYPDWADSVGETVRVYLGPSETPPSYL